MICKGCGKDIPEDLNLASFCPFCGASLSETDCTGLAGSSAREQTPQNNLIASVINESSIRKRQMLAISGAFCLLIGVFLPIISLPIVGSMNYFNNGRGDGTIVLVLAIASVILAATRRFGGLWITGFCSLGLLTFTIVNFAIRMSQLREEMKTGLAGNPFSGLADIAMNSVQMQWGLAVLLLGAILIIAAAAMRASRTEVPRTAGFAWTTLKLLGSAIFVVAVFWLAGLFSSKQSVDSNSSIEGTTPPSSTSTDLSLPRADVAPPGYPYFSDGNHIVGRDVSPGTYRTRTGSPGCYFARLAGFSGGLEDIIANENTGSPAVVTISATDKGFVSTRCGVWTGDLSAILSDGTAFGDGTYIVGTDIQAGTYRNNGQQGCYYARLSGFGGGTGNIIANQNTNSPAVITISPTDSGFKSARCGTWSLLSDQSGPELKGGDDTSQTAALAVLGFKAWESYNEAATHAFALLGARATAGECQYRKVADLTTPEWVDCPFYGNEGDSLRVSLHTKQLEQIEYRFPVGRYDAIRERVEKSFGPSNNQSSGNSENGIAVWGGVSKPYVISLIRVNDGINAIAEVDLNRKQ